MAKAIYKGEVISGSQDMPSFTSHDSLSPSEILNVGLITSGETIGSQLEKLSKISSNVRYLAANGGGGGGSIKLPDVSGASVTTSFKTATIKWTDPDDVVISGYTLATWAGTKVVRKAGSAPTSVSDGTLVVNSTTKNEYSSTGFEDTNLTYGTTYYYRFFPYTDDNVTTSGSSVNVTPERDTIQIPTQSGTLTYDGSVKTLTLSHSIGYTVTGGDQTGIDAGDYDVVLTVDSDHQWPDGSTGTKTVTWMIDKATSAIVPSSDTVVLDTSNLTGTVTFTNLLGRTIISASSNNTGSVAVTYTDSSITVSHVNQTSGSAIITVMTTSASNYAASTVTITVNAQFIPADINDATWAQIQAAAQAGTASSYWAVGDRKAVSLNGTVVGRTLSNYTWYCYILGFNHNSAKEGNNIIHFQFGFDSLSGGVHTALCQSYNSTGTGFCMNTSNTNTGGWNSSYMKSTIIPAFINCLPSALQNVLKAVTKYTDNIGNSSNVVSNVTTTSDKVFLLAEYEIFGSSRSTNQYEYTDGKQDQYSYYSAGNSKVMYNDTSIGDAVYWWVRSPNRNDSASFCDVADGGYASGIGAYRSYGFAPGFCVG